MTRNFLPALTFAGGLLLGAALTAYPSSQSGPDQAPDRLVTGIGGVFFTARDPDSLRAWYREHLGLDAGPQGTQFLWRQADDPERVGRTVWSVFPRDTDYFGASGQQCMLNYIVTDLDAVLAELAEGGVYPVKDSETYPYGRFAWVEDGEGNQVELWQP